jgi:hypothetical protein
LGSVEELGPVGELSPV